MLLSLTGVEEVDPQAAWQSIFGHCGIPAPNSFFRNEPARDNDESYFGDPVESVAGLVGVGWWVQLSRAKFAAQKAITSNPRATTMRCWAKAGASWRDWALAISRASAKARAFFSAEVSGGEGRSVLFMRSLLDSPWGSFHATDSASFAP